MTIINNAGNSVKSKAKTILADIVAEAKVHPVVVLAISATVMIAAIKGPIIAVIFLAVCGAAALASRFLYGKIRHVTKVSISPVSATSAPTVVIPPAVVPPVVAPTPSVPPVVTPVSSTTSSSSSSSDTSK